MKKSAFLLLSAFVFSAVFFFTSCEKPPITGGNVIEAKDVTSFSPNNLNKIDKVKAFVFYYDEFELKEIASCKFEKNGFTLTLPEDVPEKYLYGFGDTESTGIKVNPANAKLAPIQIIACDKSDNNIGSFFFGSEDIINATEYPVYGTTFWYLDRRVTIKGKYIDEFSTKYDCSLKKGWNILYSKLEQNGLTISSSKPSGVNYKWYFTGGYLLAPKKDSCPLITHEQIISMMPSF